MKYKFIGKPDKVFPNLKHGKVYDLEIKEVSRGLIDWLVGNTAPLIVKPFRCPYRSWGTFYQNWKRF